MRANRKGNRAMMIQRIWLLYRLEIVKALRRRQTWAGPVLVLFVVLLAPLAHPVERDGIADYSFIAYATPLALGLPGFIMLLVFCSSLVASEMERGAIRGTLVRPVTRREFLSAKLLLGYSYAALLVAIVAFSSWAVAWTLGDLLGVHLGGELVYTGASMIRAYAFGALLTLLPLCAGASVAVFFSTATRSASTAITLSLATWIVSDLLKYPLNIAPLLFTTYLEAPWQVFSHRCDALDQPWFPMVWQCILSSAAAITVAAGLAFAVFSRRNLGSC